MEGQRVGQSDPQAVPWLRRHLDRTPWMRRQLAAVESNRRLLRWWTLALATIPLVLLVYVLVSGRNVNTARLRSASQMRAILQALVQFENTHAGSQPDPSRWQSALLASSPEFPTPDMFNYPGRPEHTAYLLIPRPDGQHYGFTADDPVLCESPDITGGDGGNVAYADNRVEFLTGDSYRAVVARAFR